MLSAKKPQSAFPFHIFHSLPTARLHTCKSNSKSVYQYSHKLLRSSHYVSSLRVSEEFAISSVGPREEEGLGITEKCQGLVTWPSYGITVTLKAKKDAEDAWKQRHIDSVVALDWSIEGFVACCLHPLMLTQRFRSWTPRGCKNHAIRKWGSPASCWRLNTRDSPWKRSRTGRLPR